MADKIPMKMMCDNDESEDNFRTAGQQSAFEAIRDGSHDPGKRMPTTYNQSLPDGQCD